MSDTATKGRDPRQLRQMAYSMRAQLALGDDPRYFWLCDRSVIEAGKPRSWRPRLLAGLGRLLEEQGKEKMLELAALLCERQPDARQALALIRQRRLEGGPNSALALCEAVLAAAEEFLSASAPLTAEEITMALEEAGAALLAEEV